MLGPRLNLRIGRCALLDLHQNFAELVMHVVVGRKIADRSGESALRVLPFRGVCLNNRQAQLSNAVVFLKPARAAQDFLGLVQASELFKHDALLHL